MNRKKMPKKFIFKGFFSFFQDNALKYNYCLEPMFVVVEQFYNRLPIKKTF